MNENGFKCWNGFDDQPCRVTIEVGSEWYQIPYFSIKLVRYERLSNQVEIFTDLGRFKIQSDTIQLVSMMESFATEKISQIPNHHDLDVDFLPYKEGMG